MLYTWQSTSRSRTHSFPQELTRTYPDCETPNWSGTPPLSREIRMRSNHVPEDETWRCWMSRERTSAYQATQLRNRWEWTTQEGGWDASPQTTSNPATWHRVQNNKPTGEMNGQAGSLKFFVDGTRWSQHLHCRDTTWTSSVLWVPLMQTRVEVRRNIWLWWSKRWRSRCQIARGTPSSPVCLSLHLRLKDLY